MTDDGADPGVIKIAVMAEVKKHFRPEFVNRIDEIVVFQPLDEAQIASIARIQLKPLEQRLAKLEIRLDVADAALKAVAAAGFDPVYGARPLKRAIQQQIENPLAKGDPVRASTRRATRSTVGTTAARSCSRRSSSRRNVEQCGQRDRCTAARRDMPDRACARARRGRAVAGRRR